MWAHTYLCHFTALSRSAQKTKTFSNAFPLVVLENELAEDYGKNLAARSFRSVADAAFVSQKALLQGLPGKGRLARGPVQAPIILDAECFKMLQLCHDNTIGYMFAAASAWTVIDVLDVSVSDGEPFIDNPQRFRNQMIDYRKELRLAWNENFALTKALFVNFVEELDVDFK